MKLGLIYHQMVPAGGLERYLIEFSRQLDAAGHDLTYLTARTTAEVSEALPGHMRLISRPPGPLTRLWQFNRMAGAMASTMEVDLTLGFGRTVAQDIHRAGGGCHAEYSRLLPFWKRYKPKNLYELHLEKQLYTSGRTRHFVTNSDRVTAQLEGHYGTPEERFTTVHTAVDCEAFRPADDRPQVRQEVCAELKTDPARKVLLFVSLSHRRKGLDALLVALHRIPDAILWIVGKTLSKRYLAQVAALGIGDRIRIVPVTNQLSRIYQAADWFVHPTLYDACANTVLQSMACGLPGLISARDGAIDHLDHGGNGYVIYHPDQVDELTQVMEKALGLGEDERQAMGRAARERMEPLTWKRHVGLWEGLFEKLGSGGA